MSDVSNSDNADPNEQDNLGLAQFSPEVLEFMLGIVRTRKSKQDKNMVPKYAETVAPR